MFQFYVYAKSRIYYVKIQHEKTAIHSHKCMCAMHLERDRRVGLSKKQGTSFVGELFEYTLIMVSFSFSIAVASTISPVISLPIYSTQESGISIIGRTSGRGIHELTRVGVYVWRRISPLSLLLLPREDVSSYDNDAIPKSGETTPPEESITGSLECSFSTKT